MEPMHVRRRRTKWHPLATQAHLELGTEEIAAQLRYHRARVTACACADVVRATQRRLCVQAGRWVRDGKGVENNSGGPVCALLLLFTHPCLSGGAEQELAA
jgi:hypothetical protein